MDKKIDIVTHFEESSLECINPYTGKSGIYVICECSKCSLDADHNAGRLAQQFNNEAFYEQYKPQYPGKGQ